MRIFVILVIPMLLLSGLRLQAATNSDPDAASRVWTTTDSSSLAQQVASGKMPLPQLSDEAGAKILKRFCGLKTISFKEDNSLSVMQRYRSFLEVQMAAGTLLQLYAAEVSKGQKAGDEITMLMRYELEVCTVGFALLEELLPTLTHDALDEKRRAAFLKTKASTASLLNFGAEMIYRDVKQNLSAQNRTDLLNSLAEVAPEFSVVLGPEMKSATLASIAKLQEKFKEGKDSINLTTIINLLKR